MLGLVPYDARYASWQCRFRMPSGVLNPGGVNTKTPAVPQGKAGVSEVSATVALHEESPSHALLRRGHHAHRPINAGRMLGTVLIEPERGFRSEGYRGER